MFIFSTHSASDLYSRLGGTMQKYRTESYSSASFLSFLFLCLLLAYKHCDRSHPLSVRAACLRSPPFFPCECINMTEMTFSAQPIRENEKTEWWQSGSTVLHMYAQCGVAVSWKYVHFKPDEIRQAPNIENYAWGSLVSLTVIRWRWSLMQRHMLLAHYTAQTLINQAHAGKKWHTILLQVTERDFLLRKTCICA